MTDACKADLALIKHFFEEQFGCVVGCGCWTDDWDKSVAEFAHKGFYSWSETPAPTPRDVLSALDRAFATVTDDDLAEVERELELVFPDAGSFRAFFQRAASVLQSELQNGAR